MSKRKASGLAIFEKTKLTPSQLRTVAERRYGDARALQATGKNERANGAIYLAGFVVELCLKASLLTTYPQLQRVQSAEHLSSAADKRRFKLCYSHELYKIAVEIPDVYKRLENHGGTELLDAFKSICAEWTILARYSPKATTKEDAAHFVSRVEEIKKCLHS